MASVDGEETPEGGAEVARDGVADGVADGLSGMR